MYDNIVEEILAAHDAGIAVDAYCTWRTQGIPHVSIIDSHRDGWDPEAWAQARDAGLEREELSRVGNYLEESRQQAAYVRLRVRDGLKEEDLAYLLSAPHLLEGYEKVADVLSPEEAKILTSSYSGFALIRSALEQGISVDDCLYAAENRVFGLEFLDFKTMGLSTNEAVWLCLDGIEPAQYDAALSRGMSHEQVMKALVTGEL